MQLKQIRYDLKTFERKRIKAKFSFPLVVDMARYLASDGQATRLGKQVAGRRDQGPQQERPNLPKARGKTSPHKDARPIFLEVGQVFRLTAELRKRMIPVESWIDLGTIGKNVPLYRIR